MPSAYAARRTTVPYRWGAPNYAADRRGWTPIQIPYRGGLGALGLDSSSTVGGAAKGAATGASVGSAVPVIGTAVGAIIGALGGAISSAFNRRDQEVGNFDQAVALWQQNRNNVFNIANKYLPIAGLFDLDLHSNVNIPIYKKYGRMGEEKFVHDLAMQVYSAAQAGRITANDTIQTVMARVVQPWIDSFGFGPMSDPHADLINLLIEGLVADYVSGQQGTWRARSGDLPASFAQLPAFALPAAQAPAPGVMGGNIPVPGASQGSTPLPPAPAGPNVIRAPYRSLNGFQLYGDAQGLLYWIPSNFAAPQPYTGSAVDDSGNTYSVSNGQLFAAARPVTALPPVTPVANVPISSLPTNSTPAPQYPQIAPGGTYTLPPAYAGGPAIPGEIAPAQPAVTAGLSGNTTLWIAGGLAVLGVLFATARPVGQPTPTRRASR